MQNEQPKNSVVVALKGGVQGSTLQLHVDGIHYQIMLPDADTDYIQKKIASEGKPYEQLMLDDMRQRLKPDSLVLDIGANIGNHTLYLSAVAGCRVVAFEPNTQLCDALSVSVALNKLKKNVSIQPVALGSHDAQGHFFQLRSDNLGAQSIELGSGDIKVVPLDSFAFRTPVAAIKLDVEGMELDVLKGGEELLRADRPMLYVECQTVEKFDAVSKWLSGLNYCHWETFNATPTHLFVPGESVQLEENIARLQSKIAQEQYGNAAKLVATRKQLDEANLKYRAAMEKINALKEQVLTEQGSRKLSEQTARQADALLQEAHTTLAQLQQQHAEKSARAEHLESDRRAREQQLGELRLQLQEAEHFRQQVQKLETKIGELEQLLALKDARLQQAETERASEQKELLGLHVQMALAQQAAEHAAEHLRDSQRRSQEEQQKLQRELNALRERYEEQREGFHESEKRYIQLEGASALLQEKLDEARLKYRQSTEQARTISDAHLATQHAHEESQALALELQSRLLAHQQEALSNLGQLQQKLEAGFAAEREAAREAQHAQETLLTGQRDAAQQALQELEKQLGFMQVSQQALSEKADALEAMLASARARHESELATLKDEQARRDNMLTQLQDEVALGKNRLVDARDQYRASAEQANQFKTARDEAREALEASKASEASLVANLATAQESNSQLAAELEKLAASHRALQHEFEQVKMQSLRNGIALNDIRSRLKMANDELAFARQQVIKTRETISYQLGNALIFGFKSFDNYLRLPARLLSIYQQAKSRRTKKPAKFSHLAIAAKPKAVRREQGRELAEKPSIAITPESLKALKMAAIMDEFTESSYRHECELLQLTPQHWREQLAAFTPDLLFVESAWFGKDGAWAKKIGHKSSELVELVQWCRDHKIPTLLWNKEDPVHYETFIHAAKLVDYVFTTDIDCIHRYKEALGHERVYLLPFACQPQTHNPIEKYERKDAFCFAGAYYQRYPERTRDLGNFLASLPDFRPVEIYDRNYYKTDENYKFPQEYQPFIVGNLPFEEIEKAHKGYRYAINLNSIKQSQSMFARRVYELLGSNTITLSNYSRGLRLMFGDLVIASDSGTELLRRLNERCGNERDAAKLRLAALRKAMSEHTYQDRLAYIQSCIHPDSTISLLPEMIVLAYAKNNEQVQAIIGNFIRQEYAQKSLVLVVPAGFAPQDVPDELAVDIITVSHAHQMQMMDIGEGVSWLASMVADDYYGENYLRDIALATRYTNADMIGKAARYRWWDNALALKEAGQEYKPSDALPVRSSASRLSSLSGTVGDFIAAMHSGQGSGLSIDAFNYCKNGLLDQGIGERERAIISDLRGIDTGLSLQDMLMRAETIAPQEQHEAFDAQFDGSELFDMFTRASATGNVVFSLQDGALRIDSVLENIQHEYFYAPRDYTPQALGAQAGKLQCYMQQTPGLNVQLVMLFLSAQGKQRIGHVVRSANRNHDIELPEGTEFIRLGLRVLGSGSADIPALVWGHRSLEPVELIGRAQCLLLTNNYPSNDDLYRNAFVHHRVAAYQRRGTTVDVFRLRMDEPVSYHEFEHVECITGSKEALQRLLTHGNYKNILVHFLSEDMWDVLKEHVATTPITVWVHGAEIHPWQRRKYNLQTEKQIDDAKQASKKRMAFWRELLKEMPKNLQMVFVSQSFAHEVEEDIGFTLPKSHYRVIHNPINTSRFAYEEKPAAQRKKILSIRPFASRQYANDLSVQAILLLSEKPYFKELEFTLIGDGKLFEETVAPLRRFSNVTLEKRFITHTEIASLHKTHGVFLCPSRWDSQGVSRDEAMSSGLVPVTTAIAAIPEFTDESCAVLAPPENAQALADGIAMLYENPEKFKAMSAAAAKRVRRQSDSEAIVAQELQAL